MMYIKAKEVYVEPVSSSYYEDRLFDGANLVLNRDDTLAPFIRLRAALKQQGISLHTADRLLHSKKESHSIDYYSLGGLKNLERIGLCNDIRRRAFVIFEPPVVDPRLYLLLPKLTVIFERVYVHNIEGDGYSLKGVIQSKLHKLYWPQPRDEVIKYYWERTERLDRIVVINGNHIPRKVANELYSSRIEAMASLAKLGAVDLYGRGWAKWWSRASMWPPYWKHRKTLMSIYKGECESKYEILSRYKFSLCFENMSMKGYLTEKIFDCFYAGTVPLYLGATDIFDLVPEAAYIDCRRFSSWTKMQEFVATITDEQFCAMRLAGSAFLSSAQGTKYYDSLSEIFRSVTQCQHNNI